VLHTLDAITASGARVVYRSLDIRDRNALADTLNTVRSEYGPIRGIIHGAGVLEDRRIVDKTESQIDRVLGTKITGFRNLLELTAADPLKTVVAFSSVAARFGNAGQADYAMANEALNKMCIRAAAGRPACRVVAINWGPWDGGMVSEALKREFQRRGIGLIPLKSGSRCMLEEMAVSTAAPIEVVYGSSIPAADRQEAPVPPQRVLSQLMSQMVNVDRYPVLASHIIGGKPVVPFALITEWLGHSALHRNPGLVLHSLEDIRLFQGIKIESDGKKIRLMAGKTEKNKESYRVDVEIRNGKSDRGADLIHSSARAILSERPMKTPPEAGDLVSRIRPCSREMDEVYRSLLFHGKDLQGIEQISGLSEEGAVARLKPAPLPSAWIHEPVRSRWIGDPLMMDAAFQLAIVWSNEFRGRPCLPSYVGSYRQYCREFPKTEVTAVLTVQSASERKVTADVAFIDDSGSVIAQMNALEAIMDDTLFDAFKRSNAA
jgi:NAD(P)-dependent dehydrogenase (short-subunit alcohol dehydrogenase family)